MNNKFIHTYFGLTARDIPGLQLAKLKNIVEFHYSNNITYRKLLDDSGIHPSQLTSLEQLSLLPIIDSKQLSQDKFPGFCSLSLNDVATYLETSGSTGKPKLIPVAEKEIPHIYGHVAQMLSIAGIGSPYTNNGRGNRPIYCLFPTGPWPSSFFIQNGSEQLAPTVRADVRMPMHWHKEKLQILKPADIITYPSFLSYFYDQLKEELDFADLDLKRIVIGGEPFTEAFRTKMEAAFHTKIYDIYGCGEIAIGSIECSYSRTTGYTHWCAPELLLEVVDPETMQPVDDGEVGIMVVTNLWRKSTPIIRYVMGDIIQKTSKQCECGSSLPLVSRIKGRQDDAFCYGAANLYPDQINKAVTSAGYSDKFVLEIMDTADEMASELVMNLEYDGPEQQDSIANKINDQLASLSMEYKTIVRLEKFRPPMRIQCVKPGTLFSQSMTKLKRFKRITVDR
ncbi:phenylacetate--CoA ligase family protein [Spartinivicinus ruber]|uniref:phenylacetate--CoA ligase family protein n=1 Tax=Spartinivicinus ruber TaxID=2683272 RepID=UPI0013D7F32D|nr:AMP-binding protein [Spartinivicinus ruber]